MTTNVSIIGTGRVAILHAGAIADTKHANLHSVLSRNIKTANSFIKDNNTSSSSLPYDNIDRFVADPDLDLVIVCSPDKLHFQQTKTCLLAGKHVLLEKPMTTNISEAKELKELAMENNKTLAIGFHLRHHAGHQKIYESINNNNIGQLQHIRIIWAFRQEDDSNWRARSELARWWSLAAVGSHCLDLVRWFSGNSEPFLKTRATTNNNLWGGPNDETRVSLFIVGFVLVFLLFWGF